jgi:ubiquinone/menaquinone biosynthesis C-methylase UbiE
VFKNSDDILEKKQATMFDKTAEYYDAIYSFKDYQQEAEKLHNLIQQHKLSPGKSLLDVACGTGQHIAHLAAHYSTTGLDLDAEILALAEKRNPDIPFYQGDMIGFSLDQRFDVVTCLFSSVGYMKTIPRMTEAIANLARHAVPGGLLIIEPWLTPEVWMEGNVHALFVDKPELKIARMNITETRDGLSVFDMHYLIATRDGVEYFVEQHALGLFTLEEYETAFEAAGLKPIFIEEGLTGRGLYLGVLPVE